MKRLWAQIGFFFATNLNLKGFLTGTIYRGQFKNVCLPGLNCYSCPGALGSCPIGAIQAVIGGARHSMAFDVLGLLTLFGLALGRFICGWLCPFGLVQDLMHKIKVKKMKVPKRLDQGMRYGKYAVLAVAVILLPMLVTNAFGIASPYFCQWICPSGTLLGGIPLMIANPGLRDAIGFLFGWKMLLLVIFLGASVLIFRPFCKYVCPLGAVYALFNRISLYRLQINEQRCVHCHRCERACPMQVPVLSQPNHGECIRCGACRKACPSGAVECQRLVRQRQEIEARE